MTNRSANVWVCHCQSIAIHLLRRLVPHSTTSTKSRNFPEIEDLGKTSSLFSLAIKALSNDSDVWSNLAAEKENDKGVSENQVPLKSISRTSTI
ncbi:hypothetical protein T08_1395 [Trichinella sp. T8]|nr:hypothetical protein T08_1395 [Trichinella sp. T8]